MPLRSARNVGGQKARATTSSNPKPNPKLQNLTLKTPYKPPAPNPQQHPIHPLFIPSLFPTKQNPKPATNQQTQTLINPISYVLFTYERLRDVRIVYVPPLPLGNFGGDTDNFEWPRHTAGQTPNPKPQTLNPKP